mgnify:CR=1 FL=1
MSGLKLGDTTLDSGRVLYLHSLKACVVAGFVEATGGRDPKISQEARVGNIERLHRQFERWRASHNPDILIIIGELRDGDFRPGQPERTLVKLWTSLGVRMLFIAPKPARTTTHVLESLGCEVHQDLIWGRYRFECGINGIPIDSKFLCVSAEPRYCIKFASGMLRTRTLGVFLRGFGQILIPSLDSKSDMKSVLRSSLARYDVFAVGHQKILPLGKVADLRAKQGLITGIKGLKLTISGATAGRKKLKGGTTWKPKTGSFEQTNR